MILSRLLSLPENPKRSFFLWGPRLTGKTSLLKTTYPDALRLDLLKSDFFAKYSQRPNALREELTALKQHPKLVVIDEIQKIPPLLNEVHWLIEELGIVFALCGSSTRKLKRGHANLLGGRALRYELHGLVSKELGEMFNITRALNHGYLPINYLDDNPEHSLRSYITDYLKEEIAAEGLVRNLPAFGRFLEVAALMDTEIIQYSNIASDCAVSSPTIKEYFQILQDTMLGTMLPAYTRRIKRKVIHAPKFYMADVGVVNILAKRGKIVLGSRDAGLAFENFVHHELSAYRSYSSKNFDLHYWRLALDTEVDFILNDLEIAIEVKSTDRIGNSQLKGLREIIKEHPTIKRRILVCNESVKRITDDKIEIMPILDFTEELWAGGIC